MENSDVFSSSTPPLTWHDFLERMRHPSATEFVKAIKSFIVSFLNNAPDAERDSTAVQQFLGNMEAAFRAHSLWAGSSEEELESAGEGLEKYVMTKLFTRVFASTTEDVKIDDQLHEKMALIQQFISPENLDIKPTYQNETSWLLAQKELQKINMYKAPRDKLACILKCCKVISNLLLNASLASNNDHPGADEFLPVLIYVTIKANPPQLHSNLAYIQRFRRETRLVSEAAYFFTNMLSVESFITNIDANALSMDETEYENNMESARALLSGLSDNSFNQSDQNYGQVPKPEPMEPKPASSSIKHQRSVSSEFKSRNEESLNKIPSISDLENKGAAMLLKENSTNHVFHEYPFLYSQAGDLTVADVDDLLNNYKQLVFKYACLARGIGKVSEQPEIAKGLAKRSESKLDLVPQSQNSEQPGTGKDLENEKRSESNLDMETDTPGQNPEQPEMGKDLLENKSEGDDGQKDITSGGVDDSDRGSDMGFESTKPESGEMIVQTHGDEGVESSKR